MTSATLTVPDISCDHCKQSIEDAVGVLAGVEAVRVEIAPRTVDVSYDPGSIDVDAIKKVMEEAGYPVSG